ncbi:MAG: hypothetical protein ACREU8_04585, partial [Gammaproteobacteria bacterium]
MRGPECHLRERCGSFLTASYTGSSNIPFNSVPDSASWGREAQSQFLCYVGKPPVFSPKTRALPQRPPAGARQRSRCRKLISLWRSNCAAIPSLAASSRGSRQDHSGGGVDFSPLLRDEISPGKALVLSPHAARLYPLCLDSLRASLSLASSPSTT